MDLLISFVIFVCSVAACLISNLFLGYALFFGLICFFITGLHRGYHAYDLLKMILKGGRTSLVVIKVLFFVGLLTALWRASGTISFFVFYGIKFITPHLFILIAFLMPLILSFVLGSSFGVTGTAGVMLMILARSGGVNEVITAGAVMSGSYFGDRCSSASFASVLTANVAGIEHRYFIKTMLKTSIIPFLAVTIVYAIFSVKNPIGTVNKEVLSALIRSFNLSWIAFIPALILLALPWFKIKITNVIILSGAAAFIIAATVQGQSVPSVLKACFLGYTIQDEFLGTILSGGGVISVVNIMIMIMITSTYAGIFSGTGMLFPMQKKVGGIAGKIGLFTTQIFAALISAAVFCNQTMGIILAGQMFSEVYKEKGALKEELAADIGNSAVTLAGMIPWSIAATLPLALLGVGSEALIYSFFLYAVPVCYLFSKKIWFKTEKQCEKTL